MTATLPVPILDRKRDHSGSKGLKNSTRPQVSLSARVPGYAVNAVGLTRESTAVNAVQKRRKVRSDKNAGKEVSYAERC